MPTPLTYGGGPLCAEPLQPLPVYRGGLDVSVTELVDGAAEYRVIVGGLVLFAPYFSILLQNKRLKQCRD